MTVTLLKTIGSTHHNAPFTEELGSHWPAGQLFKLLDKDRTRAIHQFRSYTRGKVIVEQIGGEEVRVCISPEDMPQLFGINAPK